MYCLFFLCTIKNFFFFFFTCFSSLRCCWQVGSAPFVRRHCDCSASLAPTTNTDTYLLTYLLLCRLATSRLLLISYYHLLLRVNVTPSNNQPVVNLSAFIAVIQTNEFCKRTRLSIQNITESVPQLLFVQYICLLQRCEHE